jgi:hypothetical protein
VLGRSRPPREVRDRLDAGEHVLAWATTTGSAAVVATNLGLWWPQAHPRRIPWHLLDKVVWSDAGFAVVEADIVDDLLLVDRPPARVQLAEPRKLPEVVRRRVEASVLRSQQVRLSAGSARVVGRRVVGVDGVSYWARLDPGTPDSTLTRVELQAVLEPLRAEAAERLAQL